MNLTPQLVLIAIVIMCLFSFQKYGRSKTMIIIIDVVKNSTTPAHVIKNQTMRLLTCFNKTSCVVVKIKIMSKTTPKTPHAETVTIRTDTPTTVTETCRQDRHPHHRHRNHHRHHHHHRHHPHHHRHHHHRCHHHRSHHRLHHRPVTTSNVLRVFRTWCR